MGHLCRLWPLPLTLVLKVLFDQLKWKTAQVWPDTRFSFKRKTRSDEPKFAYLQPFNIANACATLFMHDFSPTLAVFTIHPSSCFISPLWRTPFTDLNTYMYEIEKNKKELFLASLKFHCPRTGRSSCYAIFRLYLTLLDPRNICHTIFTHREVLFIC